MDRLIITLYKTYQRDKNIGNHKTTIVDGNTISCLKQPQLGNQVSASVNRKEWETGKSCHNLKKKHYEVFLNCNSSTVT